MADESTVATLLRTLAPQVLAAVARRRDDFGAAEDAVQDALIAAAAQWPVQGVPENPRGWLFQVAVRRMTDQARSEIARRRREEIVAGELHADEIVLAAIDGDGPLDERDTLILLFMCCHPALSDASAIALTLRAVGGLTTAEIASAFLVPEATMAQRISRAKQTVRTSNISFALPSADERAERLRNVLHVLYLIFNEGYASTSGASVQRTDLSDEAIRLARGVRVLLPGHGEVAGLLALMLLTDARRAARIGTTGQLIPLDEQDRTRWDHDLIAEGVALVSDALPRGEVGPYQLQAAIAAVHDEAAMASDTDWPQIEALYSVLMRISDNPVVALNHAVAAAMVHGPRRGLELVGALERDPRMAGSYRLVAARAHLLEMDGQFAAAKAAYLAAADGTASTAERDYLWVRAARLQGAESQEPGAERA